MNILIYVITILISLWLRFIYKYGVIEDLLFILKPVMYIVEKFSAIKFNYLSGGFGFINKDLGIQIVKECSGVNFFIISITMLIFSFVHKIESRKYKLVLSSFFLIISYIATILANASRIIGTVFIMNTGLLTNGRVEGLVHQSIGVVVYFIYLVIVYYIASRLIVKVGDKSESNI